MILYWILWPFNYTFLGGSNVPGRTGAAVNVPGCPFQVLLYIAVSLTSRFLRWTARRITPPTCPHLLTPAGEGTVC